MKRCIQCRHLKPLADFSPSQTQCRKCRADNAREKYASTAKAVCERIRKASETLRVAVFGHYGQACACCGSSDDLTIDHINGGGQAHRDQLANGGRGGHGGQFCRWLIKNGFPEGFQALCRPCNASKKEGSRCNLDHAKAANAA
jgi:hypothetical protein